MHFLCAQRGADVSLTEWLVPAQFRRPTDLGRLAPAAAERREPGAAAAAAEGRAPSVLRRRAAAPAPGERRPRRGAAGPRRRVARSLPGRPRPDVRRRRQRPRPRQGRADALRPRAGPPVPAALRRREVGHGARRRRPLRVRPLRPSGRRPGLVSFFCASELETGERDVSRVRSETPTLEGDGGDAARWQL